MGMNNHVPIPGANSATSPGDNDPFVLPNASVGQPSVARVKSLQGGLYPEMDITLFADGNWYSPFSIGDANFPIITMYPYFTTVQETFLDPFIGDPAYRSFLDTDGFLVIEPIDNDPFYVRTSDPQSFEAAFEPVPYGVPMVTTTGVLFDTDASHVRVSDEDKAKLLPMDGSSLTDALAAVKNKISEDGSSAAVLSIIPPEGINPSGFSLRVLGVKTGDTLSGTIYEEVDQNTPVGQLGTLTVTDINMTVENFINDNYSAIFGFGSFGQSQTGAFSDRQVLRVNLSIPSEFIKPSGHMRSGLVISLTGAVAQRLQNVAAKVDLFVSVNYKATTDTVLTDLPGVSQSLTGYLRESSVLAEQFRQSTKQALMVDSAPPRVVFNATGLTDESTIGSLTGGLTLNSGWLFIEGSAFITISGQAGALLTTLLGPVYDANAVHVGDIFVEGGQLVVQSRTGFLLNSSRYPEGINDSSGYQDVRLGDVKTLKAYVLALEARLAALEAAP